MRLDHLVTELLTEILSYSLQGWLNQSFSDSQRSDAAYQDLRRQRDVCTCWRMIIDHRILSEINKLETRIFRQRVLHAAEWGHAVFIEMAYASKSAHLLSKAASSTLTAPLEYAALAKAARHDRYTVVRIFINRGLDLNANYLNIKQSYTRRDGYASTSGKRNFYTNALRDSVACGHYRTAQLLLENGADANNRTYGLGKPPLFYAVGPFPDELNAPPSDVLDAPKRIAMTRLLLDHGGDISIRSNRNESILYAAACGGYAGVLQLLLEAGAHTLMEDITQTDGFTPLMAASCAKHGAVTRMLLERGADCNAHAADGLDALTLAVELNHPGIDPTSTMEALLDYSADVNGDGQPVSPLSWAVYWNNHTAVKMLLAAGANVNKVDSQGATPLETWLALRPGRYPGYGVRAMLRTASQTIRKPSPAILRELLEKGADANWRMSNGNTLLIQACSAHGSYDRVRLLTVQALLLHGADVNGRNNNGDTPLITVCSTTSLGDTQRIRMISELIKYKANTDLTNHQGETAVTKAIDNIDQDLRIIGILLTCNANVNQPNAMGDTPLMSVCANTTLPQFRRLELLKLLSRQRINFNHTNRRGDSALTKALVYQDFSFIKALLAINLNVNQANQNGKTPLTLTCGSKLSLPEKVEIVELLIAKGACVNKTALVQGLETFILEAGDDPQPDALSDS